MPLLAPVLTVVFVTQIIGVLKIFDLDALDRSGLEPGRRGHARLRDVAARRSAARTCFGLGSAIATFILLLFIPFLIVNIRRFRADTT